MLKFFKLLNFPFACVGHKIEWQRLMLGGKELLTFGQILANCRGQTVCGESLSSSDVTEVEASRTRKKKKTKKTLSNASVYGSDIDKSTRS